MRPTAHVIVSSVTGGVLSVWLHSWEAGMGCLLGGVFIDIDHHIDYYFDYKKIPWRYKDLIDYCTSPAKDKLYLIFHAYEFLVLLWLAVFLLKLNSFWIGLGVGVSVHMMCDQFYNPLRPLAYFILYRIKNGFESKKLYTPEFLRKIS